MHRSNSYANILGATNFHARGIPRSGSKAKDGGKERKRLNDGNNNGQVTHASTHGACKPPGPKIAAGSYTIDNWEGFAQIFGKVLTKMAIVVREIHNQMLPTQV